MQLVLLPSFWFYHSFKCLTKKNSLCHVISRPWAMEPPVGQGLRRSPSEFSWLLGPGPKLPFPISRRGSIPKGLSLQSTLLAGSVPEPLPFICKTKRKKNELINRPQGPFFQRKFWSKILTMFSLFFSINQSCLQSCLLKWVRFSQPLLKSLLYSPVTYPVHRWENPREHIQ